MCVIFFLFVIDTLIRSFNRKVRIAGYEVSKFRCVDGYVQYSNLATGAVSSVSTIRRRASRYNTAVAGQDGYHLTGGGYWGSFVREGVKRANGVAR